MTNRLLTEFERLFRNTRYFHRSSKLGDWVAIHLYEDLVTLAKSRSLVDRVASAGRVITSDNQVQGISSRRGDGTFGEIVPGETPIRDKGYWVARARTATIEIGAEVKIVSKAMVRQVGRVSSDLRDQVEQFRRAGGRPISVGIVGINFADHYVSYEGSRSFPTTGRGRYLHPVQEAKKAELFLRQNAQPSFDHFIFLRFRATNEEPYPFEWVRETATRRNYGAMLVRISAQYDRRFRD